jgi:topoisomerase-4 subunit A
VPRQHAQGQAGAQRQAARRCARAIAPVEGELVAAIGENRKMLVFPIDQVPEMTRGRGVRLQRHKDGGLSDIKTFEAEKGLTWTDTAGRVFTLSLKELADWRGNRADAGRLAPKGFPKNKICAQAPPIVPGHN